MTVGDIMVQAVRPDGVIQGKTLEVKVTNACNLACGHCMNGDSPGKSRDTYIEKIIEGISEFQEETGNAGLKEVRLTGGEPLLRMPYVERVAETCTRYAIACGVNTNGTLLTAENVGRMARAGMSLVKISFDATSDELLHSLRGSIANVSSIEENARRAVDAGMTVVYRFTLSRRNVDELCDCYTSAVRQGATQFQIKPLIRSGRALRIDPAVYLTRDEITAALARLSEYVDERTPVTMLCWSPLYSAGLRSKTCGSLDKVYVDTQLNVCLCNYIVGDTGLGNLNEIGLHEAFRRQSEVERTTLGCGGKMPTRCPQISLVY